MTKDELRKALDFVNEERERLQKENDKWWAIIKDNEKEITHQLLENIELEARIDKAINKIQYIKDIGFDYDGFNNVEDLKKLIDELVRIAKGSIDILRGEEVKINEIKKLG